MAAKLDDVIVWSWHVWVADYDPIERSVRLDRQIDGTSYTFMDRNLGAKNAKKYDAGALGLLYQWGRKDPFVNTDGTESSVYVAKYDIDGNRVREVSEERPTHPSSDYESTNLQLAIQNPTIFYTAPSSSYPVQDWLTDDAQRQTMTCGAVFPGYKTKYDPCPEGWKVPVAGAPWGFRSEYRKTGGLQDDGAMMLLLLGTATMLMIMVSVTSRPIRAREYWFPFTGKRRCDRRVERGRQWCQLPYGDSSEHVGHYGVVRVGQSGQRDGSPTVLTVLRFVASGVMTAQA